MLTLLDRATIDAFAVYYNAKRTFTAEITSTTENDWAIIWVPSSRATTHWEPTPTDVDVSSKWMFEAFDTNAHTGRRSHGALTPSDGVQTPMPSETLPQLIPMLLDVTVDVSVAFVM